MSESKEVMLEITINKDGKIISKAIGTEGEECVELMNFLDNLKDLKHEETIYDDSFFTKISSNSHITTKK